MIMVVVLLDQWLSVPFAMTHPAVGSISETAPQWIGTIATEDIAVWIDGGLLLVFGGIPWQVSQRSNNN